MVNQILLTTLLVTFLCVEMYLLGKKISAHNNLFINNESAIWILGVIAYYGINFFLFGPFIWLKIHIIYFVIIFVMKEFIILSYIFLGKERISLASINYQNIISMIIMSFLIMIMFNFVIYFQNNNLAEIDNLNNKFNNIWAKVQDVIVMIISLPKEFVNKWLLGFISSTVIYASINAILTRFGKHQNIFESFFSGLISLGFIFIFNFHQNLHNLFASYLTLFSIFVVLNILQFSRKRYSFVFIINFLVAWMINPKTFIALSTIAVATAIIYLWMKKPMSSLFIVQLTTPILVVLASLFSAFSILLSTSLIIIIFIYYVSLVLVGKKQVFLKINGWLEKYSQIIPYVNSLIILISSLLIIFLLPISWSQVFGEKNLIFDHSWVQKNQHQLFILQIAQWVIYIFTVCTLVVILIYWKYKNIKFIGMRIIMLIVCFIFAFAYNPLFNAILIALNLQDNFTYIRSITFMPLCLFAIISSHNLIIQKKLIVS